MAKSLKVLSMYCSIYDDESQPRKWPKRVPKFSPKTKQTLIAFGILCIQAVLGGTNLVKVESTDISKAEFLGMERNVDNEKTARFISARNPHSSKYKSVLDANLIYQEILQMNVTTSGYPILQSNDQSIAGYPWKYIVEPYKTTVFQIDGPTSLRDEGDYFIWEIIEHNGKIALMKGEVMFYQFRDVTMKSMVTLRQFNKNGDLKAIKSEQVMCKYVRREVRELVPEDLKLLMDTMQILWVTSSEDGRKLYGDKFKGIDYFNMKHITQGADPECNHFHEGPGFINQHLALTLEFEQALQSVEPSVTVPFWDFTIDAELYGADWSLYTPVLDDNVFGPGLSPSYVVNRGRWAYSALGDYGTYFNKTPFHNSYGLLRPPWNNNPYPYLTRWHNIAGADRKGAYPNDCNDYWEALHDQTWTDFALDANTKAHGSLHGLLGGIWYDYKNPYEEGLTLPLGTGILFVKYFWRAGFIDCPKYCSPDVPRSECRCHCNFKGKSWLEVLDDVELLLEETIYKDKISQFYIKAKAKNFKENFSNIDDYVQHLFEEMICDPGSIGDNFDAESTHDPTFWPMHPTFERLQHWMRLSPETYEYDWGVNVFSCVGHNPEISSQKKKAFMNKIRT